MNHRAWMVLLRAPGVGPATGALLLKHLGSVEAILSANRSTWQRLGVPQPAQDWLANPDAPRIDTDLAWLDLPGNHFVAYDDPRYPSRLKEIGDSPLGLFVTGDPEVLATIQLAIVGSRNPTPVGRDNARAFAGALATSGLVITSGLALGIDGTAHEGALESGGLTVAVCGTGLDRVYPAQHRELARRIAGQGVLVSEFPPGTPPLKENFPRRNRLISGMSVGVLVVEAALQSGSLITARQAASQGREVFAIPGSIHNPLAKGCHRLIREGAKLVESAQDILEEIGPLLPTLAGAASHASTAGTETAGAIIEEELDQDYEILLQAMGYESTRIDQLIERSGLTPAAVSSMLLILELRGLVATTPGGAYMRVK